MPSSPSKKMLAYVFWHHPADGVDAAVYEESLRTFHRALASHAPEGFLGSAAFAFRGVSWFPAEAGYLDWYNVADFAGLGALNDAAVAGARKEPHDDVARIATDRTKPSPQRMAAIDAMVATAPRRSIEKLGLLLLDSSEASSIREAAARGLGGIDDDHARAQLLKGLSVASPTLFSTP